MLSTYSTKITRHKKELFGMISKFTQYPYYLQLFLGRPREWTGEKHAWEQTRVERTSKSDKRAHFFYFLFHIFDYCPIFVANSCNYNVRIVFYILAYLHYNDHDPLGGYVNFHIRKQALLYSRTNR